MWGRTSSYRVLKNRGGYYHIEEAKADPFLSPEWAGAGFMPAERIDGVNLSFCELDEG